MKHTVKRLLSLLLVLILCLSLFPVAALAEPEGEIAPVEDSAEPGEDCVLDVPPDGSGSISMVPPPAEQQDTLPSGTCGDRLSWIFDEDSGVLTISGDGAMQDYTWSTSGIDSPWYSYRSQIVTVVLPDGITSVGNNAFRNCYKMESINLPLGITSIGASAFAYCSALKTVTIPGTVQSMGGSAFYGCAALQTLVIEEGVPSLGTYAFSGCTSLTSVTLPQSLQTINAQAFKNTKALTSITIPKRVTNIGTEAFADSGLTEVHFACFAPTFGTDVFLNCSLTAYYPGADGSWTAQVRQQYGGTVNWVPVIQSYDLTIAGTRVTETNLSGLIDNTFHWHYEPDANTLHLQGNYNLPSDYSYDYLISNSIDGLTIRMDNTVRLYAPKDKDLNFFVLNADTTITSASDACQLQINGNTGLTTGAQVGDGVRLTLEDANLFFSGLTYGLVGGSGSKLDLVRSTGDIRGTWGAVRTFSGGISMQNCEITVPENYTIGSDSSICGSNGTSVAPRVCFEPSYGLVIDGVPVTEDNRSDVLDNGIFSFDGVHTLTVSGDYTGTADVLIDSNLYSLVVNVPGTAVLTNSSSASETALIRSSGDLFLSGGGYLSLKHADNAGDDSCGVLLIGANEATLSVQQCMLNVSNVARGFATSNVGQSLRLYKAEVKISSFDTAVSGFTGGVTLTDCAYVTPAYAGEKNGTVIIDSIWGDAPCANLEITGKTVYDLIVDNTRVYADNLDDIRGAGVFSFDPGTNTLHVSGVYDPETIWSGWAINKFRPVIDSSIDGLIIRVDGDTVLTSYLENYNSYTPVINSLGALTICAEGETMPVLTLAHKDDSIPFDGIHTAGALTLQNVDLQIDHCGRGLVGDGTAASSLTFDAACASIMATDGAEDAAVITGFPGGISLQNGSIYFYPGFSVVNGTLYQYGEISLGVRISTGGYNLFVDGYQISNERLSMNFGTIVYDPEANVLYLNGSGEAPVACDRLPYIENHIPGLTIHVVNAIKLPTATEATGRGIIETDVDMTIRSNNCYLALEGNGSGATGIMVKNGAKLTLDGARINILNVGYGVRGEGGAKLEVVQSWVHANDTASAGLYGFSGGLTLRETDLHTPSGGVIKSGSVFEPDGTTLAKSVELFGAVYELNIDGHWVTYENRADILGDGTFSYDPDTNTLTVSKSYSSASSATLIQNQIPGLTIALAGDVTLTNTYEDSIINLIYSTGDLTLTGGRLTLLGNGQEESCGLRLSGDDTNLTLDHTVLAVENVTFGLAGRGTGQKLTVLDASLDVSASAAALSLFDGGLSFSDGCGVIEPQNYTLNDDGTVCLGSTPAAHVVVGPLNDYSLWLGETQVTILNKDDILGDGTASYDPSTKTLTLNNFTGVQGTHNDALIFAEIDMLTLNLVGTNTLSGSADLSTNYTMSGINAGGKTLIIAGEGSLLIDIATGRGAAIGACDHLIMESGSLCAYAKQEPDQAFAIYGVTVKNLTINGGVLDIYGTYACMPYRSSDHFAIADDYVIMAGYRTDGKDVSACTLSEFLNLLANYPRYNYVHFAPLTAYDLWLGETQVTTLNKDDILGDGTASYDPETNTLTLNQANLRSYGVHDGSWCVVYAEMPLTIAGTGSISMINSGSVGRCAVRVAGGSVTINGDISITVSNPSTGWQSYAVLATGPVYVTGGNVSVTADGSEGFHGSSFRITGGELTVSCKTVTTSSSTKMGVGLDTWDVTISGGKATFNCGSYGMIVRRTLNMTGGELNIEKGGLTSYAADMTFSGGTATLSGLYSNSGTWMLTVENDARLSVNSTVKVPGGIVIGDGLAITTPAGGKIVQITPESGDPYYTVTESDGATVASRVVIEPLVAYPLWLGETQVTNANAADILGDGTASFDPATNTLTFTTAMPSITGLHENALIYAENDLILQLPSTGLMLNGSADTLICSHKGSITIRGSILVGNAYGAGLRAQKNITIQGSISGTCKDLPIYTPAGSLLVTGDVEVYKTGSAGYVIYAVMGVEIQGSASVNASGSTDYLIAAENGSITLNSDFDLSNTSGYGLYAKSDITVNGSVTGTCRNRLLYAAEGSILITGDVDVTSYISASSYALYANGNIEIRGSAKIESTGVSDYGLYSGGTVTMSSGTWDIAASGTAIYAQNGIVIPATHGISSPHGGKIAQVSGHWTVTEADGATVAKHVVIEKAYFWLGEIPVTESNKDDPLQNGQASFVPATSTLTFTAETPNIPGVHEFGSNNALIYADGIDLTIEASRGLTLSNSGEGYRYGVYIRNHDVVINGSVNITGGYYAISGGNVTINGSSTVEGTNYIGINCTDLTVDGDLIATGKYEGVYAYGTVNVTGDLTCTSENIGLNGRDTTVGGNMIVTGGGGEASYPYGAQINGTLNVAGNLEARGDYNGLSCGDAEIKGDLIAIGRDYIGISCGALTVEKNVVASGKYEGVYAYGTVNVTGDLTCTSEKVGLVGRDTTVGGNMKVTGGGGEVSYPYGASINGTLNVAGNLEARGDYTGLSCGDAEIKGDLIAVGRDYIGIGCTDLTVDGDLTASGKYEGVYAQGTVKTKGNVFAEATDGYMGIYGEGALVILGGRVEAKVSGSGLAKYAIFVKEGITFPSTHVISEPANAVMKTVENESAGGSAGSGVVIVDEDDQPATHVIIQPNLGDINRDGQVNALDLMLLRKYLVELPIEGTFDEAAADLNGDNVIDILDLVRLCKVLA